MGLHFSPRHHREHFPDSENNISLSENPVSIKRTKSDRYRSDGHRQHDSNRFSGRRTSTLRKRENSYSNTKLDRQLLRETQYSVSAMPVTSASGPTFVDDRVVRCTSASVSRRSPSDIIRHVISSALPDVVYEPYYFLSTVTNEFGELSRRFATLVHPTMRLHVCHKSFECVTFSNDTTAR